MMLGGVCFSYLYYKNKKSEDEHDVQLKSPFTLGPAIKFGAFFAFILLLSKAAQIYLGTKGLYLTSLLSGLADMDAITISVANLAANGSITNSVAASSITIAALSSMITKGAIVYMWGNDKLKKKVFIAFSIIFVLGVLSIFFL